MNTNTSKRIVLGQRRSLPQQDFIQRPILSVHEEHALKQTILRSVLEQLCVAQQSKETAVAEPTTFSGLTQAPYI